MHVYMYVIIVKEGSVSCMLIGIIASFFQCSIVSIYPSLMLLSTGLQPPLCLPFANLFSTDSMYDKYVCY